MEYINKIICGDCLIEHEKVESGSVDLILSDLPYGNMKGINNPQRPKSWGNPEYLKWDESLPIDKIYEIANRILRKNGKMVLFSQEPYTSRLITEAISNVSFSYRMIWEKNDFANALLCNKSPVSYFEDILVFNKKYDMEAIHPLRPYFKKVMDFIGLNLKQINTKLGHRKAEHVFYVTPKEAIMKEVGQKADHTFRYGSTQFSLCTEQTYNELIEVFGIDKMEGFRTFVEISKESDGLLNTFNLWEDKKYKSNILKYNKEYERYHPTQKPILLLEDLIKTFSNEGDLVVDLTAGSGSTAVACISTNRNYILIEKEEKYVELARRRVNATPEPLFV